MSMNDVRPADTECIHVPFRSTEFNDELSFHLHIRNCSDS